MEVIDTDPASSLSHPSSPAPVSRRGRQATLPIRM